MSHERLLLTVFGGMQVFGLIVMSFGIYFTVDKASFVTLVVGNALPYLSSLLLTLTGAIGIGVSLIGCCGAISRKTFLISFVRFSFLFCHIYQ